MWIRSQDGKKLIESNQLVVNGNKIICCKWIMGEYSSEKRTMEVLKEIQQHIDLEIQGTYIMPKE